MKRSVIVVAGGSGKRMGNDIPKQFLIIGDKPILMHTILAFFNFDPKINIVLVLPKNDISFWKELCDKYSFSIDHSIVEGGEERYDSVKNGLSIIPENTIVAIHDGVRPFVSKDVINNCYNIALEKGNAVPCMPINESIRKIDNSNSVSVNRSGYRAIQTPQVFNAPLIKKAYAKCNNNQYTDDASVLEALGGKIHLVDGNIENIKITTPLDLKIAEIILQA